MRNIKKCVDSVLDSGESVKKKQTLKWRFVRIITALLVALLFIPIVTISQSSLAVKMTEQISSFFSDSNLYEYPDFDLEEYLQRMLPNKFGLSLGYEAQGITIKTIEKGDKYEAPLQPENAYLVGFEKISKLDEEVTMLGFVYQYYDLINNAGWFQDWMSEAASYDGDGFLVIDINVAFPVMVKGDSVYYDRLVGGRWCSETYSFNRYENEIIQFIEFADRLSYAYNNASYYDEDSYTYIVGEGWYKDVLNDYRHLQRVVDLYDFRFNHTSESFFAFLDAAHFLYYGAFAGFEYDYDNAYGYDYYTDCPVCRLLNDGYMWTNDSGGAYTVLSTNDYYWELCMFYTYNMITSLYLENYTIEHITAPKGYATDNEIFSDILPYYDSYYSFRENTIIFESEPLAVNIANIDSDTRERISGGEFKIFYYDHDMEEIVESWDADVIDGGFSINFLELINEGYTDNGYYRISQTARPTGYDTAYSDIWLYLDNNEYYLITNDGNDWDALENNSIIYIENDVLIGVTLVNQDVDTGEPISGAKFGIIRICEDDCEAKEPGEELCDVCKEEWQLEVIIGNNGRFSLNIEDWSDGMYFVEEIEPAVGYNKDSTAQMFEIRDGEADRIWLLFENSKIQPEVSPSPDGGPTNNDNGGSNNSARRSTNVPQTGYYKALLWIIPIALSFIGSVIFVIVSFSKKHKSKD